MPAVAAYSAGLASEDMDRALFAFNRPWQFPVPQRDTDLQLRIPLLRPYRAAIDSKAARCKPAPRGTAATAHGAVWR